MKKSKVKLEFGLMQIIQLMFIIIALILLIVTIVVGIDNQKQINQGVNRDAIIDTIEEDA